MPLVAAVGYDCFRRPISLSPHVHAGFELTCITAGEVSWMLDDGKRLELRGGDMALVQPGMPHRGQWDIIRPCRLFWILYEPDQADAGRYAPFAPEELAALGRDYHALGNQVAAMGPTLVFCFEELLRLMAGRGGPEETPLDKALARSLLCQIMVLSRDGFAACGGKPSPSPFAGDVAAFVGKNLGRELDVAALAAAFNLSPARFNEKFKREAGQTPADYISRARCAKARELLLKTRKPVTMIAFDLGFSSSQYFASVFRKYTGMSPKEFRDKRGD